MNKTGHPTAGHEAAAADLQGVDLSPELIAEAMDIRLRFIFHPEAENDAEDRAAGPPDRAAAGPGGKAKKEQSPEAATFARVYSFYHEYKCSRQDLSRQSIVSMQAAYKHLADFHDRILDDVSIMELQNLVNNLAGSYSKSTVSNVIRLIRSLYRFALPRELCTKEYGLFVDRPRLRDENHHEDFTDSDLVILWEHQTDPIIRMILVMCYTGFRVSAYDRFGNMQTVIEGVRIPYLKGGVKTESGRNRTVPIHSAVLPLIRLMDRSSDGSIIYLCGLGPAQFRRRMTNRLEEMGLRPLTPHSTRHTFNRLLEKAGVNAADRKRLMGHSLKTDLINGTYGHRTLEELSAEIEKIRVPALPEKSTKKEE